VYDFVHALDRLLAEEIRRALFNELHSVYSPPERGRSPKPSAEFAPLFLDSVVYVRDEPQSLRDTLREYFVRAIEREKVAVANGGKLARTTPMSAILFGPPGTSKTQLAKLTGKFLGWPVLSVDPSYLVEDGLEHLYARANRLFSMLAMAEQIVVLLDEFDEMGRERTMAPDLLSRFITTSTLPKLAAINDERKIVFLLATNYVSQFDAAFSRGGRFDMLLQIMPPTAEAKLSFDAWSGALNAALDQIRPERKRTETLEFLEDLTYLETEQLVFTLRGNTEGPFDAFEDARDKGTLARTHSDKDKKTWKQTCVSERSQIRLPAAPSPIGNVNPVSPST
jgi:ATPase family associated with various cellular activities (AAA)